MLSLSEILRIKMASSTKRLISDFFKKPDMGDDQNPLSWSYLDQAIKNVETKGERDRTRKIFKE